MTRIRDTELCECGERGEPKGFFREGRQWYCTACKRVWVKPDEEGRLRAGLEASRSKGSERDPSTVAKAGDGAAERTAATTTDYVGEE